MKFSDCVVGVVFPCFEITTQIDPRNDLAAFRGLSNIMQHRNLVYEQQVCIRSSSVRSHSGPLRSGRLGGTSLVSLPGLHGPPMLIHCEETWIPLLIISPTTLVSVISVISTLESSKKPGKGLDGRTRMNINAPICPQSIEARQKVDGIMNEVTSQQCRTHSYDDDREPTPITVSE